MPLADLSDDRLSELVTQGESERLEFKTRLPDPRLAAREIASLANSGGGLLIIGVQEGEGAVGVRDAATERDVLERSLALVFPPAEVELGTAELDGKQLLLAEVQGDQLAHQGPDGAIAQRTPDGRRVAVSGGDLRAVIEQRASAESTTLDEAAMALLEQMNVKLEESTRVSAETQEALQSERADAASERQKAAKARTLRGQLPGWLASAAIGAVMGAGITAALGIG